MAAEQSPHIDRLNRADPWQTRLCRMLGIRYPIVQAGMAGGFTTPALVAAVSEAGGLGILAASRVSPAQLRADIAAIRRQTDKPFGVNLILAGPEARQAPVSETQRFLNRFRRRLGLPEGPTDFSLPPSNTPELITTIIEERVRVLSVALGDPVRGLPRPGPPGCASWRWSPPCRKRDRWQKPALISSSRRERRPAAIGRPSWSGREAMFP